MNPDKHNQTYRKTKKKTRKKTVTKAYTGSTRPKEVYALRSGEEHDDAGVWHKVFMLYAKNTVAIVEFENGIIDEQSTHSYDSARTVWQNHIDNGMNRDDSCIEDLPLGDVKI